MPLCDVTYLYNLDNLGYDKALEFMSRVQSVDATPGPDELANPIDGPDDNTMPQGKATDKCRLKLSTKEPESTDLSLDAADETGETIHSQEADAGEAAEMVDDTALAEGDKIQDDVPPASMTANKVRELIHSLMRKSTILDECRVRVRSAVGKAVAEHTKVMFKPFTGYILSIRPKMVDCNYEAYCENSSLIREKTNTFYERARALNKSLDENVTPKPALGNDGRTSGAEVEETDDPF